MSTLKHLLAIPAALALAVGCVSAAPPPLADPAPAARAAAVNAVVDWNRTAARAALAGCLAPVNDPLHESRMYTMVHVAVHDALNSIRRYAEPYVYEQRTNGKASPEAAVAAASRTVMVEIFRNQHPKALASCSKPALEVVRKAYAKALREIPNGPLERAGLRIGRAAAAAVINDRDDDGSADGPYADPNYPQGKRPGEYRFTEGYKFYFEPNWGEVDTFVLRDASNYRPDPPYRLSGRKYAADFNEVKAYGKKKSTVRTPDQTQIARFWVESSPLAWNRVARTVASQEDVGLWHSARLFGLLNLALADGYISVFDAKRHFNFWRPETAIRLAARDGNTRTTADRTWDSLLPAPPIADHDSGHSVEGGAAAGVLKRFFETDKLKFKACSMTLVKGKCTDKDPTMRTYRGFTHAAQENGVSRIYVGFHFRNAVREGIEHGDKIARRTMEFLEPYDR